MLDDKIVLQRAKQGMLNGLLNVQKKHGLSIIELVLLMFEIEQDLLKKLSLKKLSNKMPRA